MPLRVASYTPLPRHTPNNTSPMKTTPGGAPCQEIHAQARKEQDTNSASQCPGPARWRARRPARRSLGAGGCRAPTFRRPVAQAFQPVRSFHAPLPDQNLRTPETTTLCEWPSSGPSSGNIVVLVTRIQGEHPRANGDRTPRRRQARAQQHTPRPSTPDPAACRHAHAPFRALLTGSPRQRLYPTTSTVKEANAKVGFAHAGAQRPNTERKERYRQDQPVAGTATARRSTWVRRCPRCHAGSTALVAKPRQSATAG